MFTLQCHHHITGMTSSLDRSPLIIFPNFIRKEKQNIYSRESLYFGRFIYLGGNVAVERDIIEKYSAQIVHHDISMMGNAASLNQEAMNRKLYQLMPIDRRSLGNVIQCFLVLQLELNFGAEQIFAPCHTKYFRRWAWERFPKLLSCFIYLWTNHQSIVGSCGEHCSKCLIVDGHQKCRRRICAFKDVKVDTAEIHDLKIGCCRTPVKSSRFCELHQPIQSQENSDTGAPTTSSKAVDKKEFKYYHNRSVTKNHRLSATGCRTLKAKSDDYVKGCARSFGIIAIVSNCRIITSFSELYRSETLREIINLFGTTIRGNFFLHLLFPTQNSYLLVAGRLAPTLVYDDGCHLLKYVKNHLGRDLNETSAMQLFSTTPISVDRSHFRNHVDPFCRSTMNPDKNPCMNFILA